MYFFVDYLILNFRLLVGFFLITFRPLFTKSQLNLIIMENTATMRQNMEERIKAFHNSEVFEIENEVVPNPKVSVCVVTYQHKNYIAQCLDSILMQKTNFPIEILLGEGDSSDGTREICIDYAKKYPKVIRLFLQFLYPQHHAQHKREHPSVSLK